jgi:hypothetical protein
MTMLREIPLYRDSKAATELLVVVGPHVANLSRGTHKHYLGGLAAANIVKVVDDNRLYAPEHINQIEVEIRKGLNTSEEVFPQCGLFSHRVIAIQ